LGGGPTILSRWVRARGPGGGDLGFAGAGRFFACGALVAHTGATAAIATQAFVDPLWGTEGLPRVLSGAAPSAVLEDFVARDAGADLRQAHILTTGGAIAQHTGAACVPWCGHACAEGVSVAGNMLTGPDVVNATLAAFQASEGAPMAERLLAAMAAGEAAGGDKRGRQAAALRVHSGQPYPALDLRVDDHGDPLAELRRLYAVSQERFVHFAVGLPTLGAFSGQTDRAPIDAAIARAEAERQARGLASASFATDNPQ